jgi:hypothetical protein
MGSRCVSISSRSHAVQALPEKWTDVFQFGQSMERNPTLEEEPTLVTQMIRLTLHLQLNGKRIRHLMGPLPGDRRSVRQFFDITGPGS